MNSTTEQISRPSHRLRYSAYVIVLVAALTSAVGLGWLLSKDMLGRAQAMARLTENWEQKWPFERGKFLPMRLSRTLTSYGLITPVRVEIEPRISFMASPTDLIEVELLTSPQGWSPDVWDMIATNLQPGGTFIDIGAHIGTLTLKGAKAVGDSGTVMAFEPNPATFAKLSENVKVNQWDRVQLFQLAVGEKPGRLPLYLGVLGNTGTASLSQKFTGGKEFVEVDIVRLDDMIAKANLSRIDVIKIDTEGAETQIIRGAHDTLAKFRPVMVMETIDNHLTKMGSSLAELDALMIADGYQIGKRTDTDTKWIPGDKPHADVASHSK